MRILIATGLFPPDIGGPAQYAKHLVLALEKQGHTVDVVSFAKDRDLPTGIRHVFYFARILPYVRRSDFIIAMDTFSAGFPAVLAAEFFGKRIALRVGGDFLWESFVERTHRTITLREFNRKRPALSAKEKIVFTMSAFAMKHASAVVFNSEWQKNIFRDSYGLSPGRLFVVENFYGERIAGETPQKKNFLWAGRPMFLKNTAMLKRAFTHAQTERSGITLECISGMPYEELKKKIAECYAVVLPSFSDVHPNFIIDALQAGRPFIMTRESGLAEKLCDIGICIDPFDERGLVESIMRLAEDAEYREYKKRVESFLYTHSWEEIAHEFTNIYTNIQS